MNVLGPIDRFRIAVQAMVHRAQSPSSPHIAWHDVQQSLTLPEWKSCGLSWPRQPEELLRPAFLQSLFWLHPRAAKKLIYALGRNPESIIGREVDPSLLLEDSSVKGRLSLRLTEKLHMQPVTLLLLELLKYPGLRVGIRRQAEKDVYEVKSNGMLQLFLKAYAKDEAVEIIADGPGKTSFLRAVLRLNLTHWGEHHATYTSNKVYLVALNDVHLLTAEILEVMNLLKTEKLSGTYIIASRKMGVGPSIEGHKSIARRSGCTNPEGFVSLSFRLCEGQLQMSFAPQDYTSDEIEAAEEELFVKCRDIFAAD